jgi:hypothetical protein
MPHRRLFGLAGTRLEAIVKRRGEGIDSARSFIANPGGIKIKHATVSIVE